MTQLTELKSEIILTQSMLTARCDPPVMISRLAYLQRVRSLSQLEHIAHQVHLLSDARDPQQDRRCTRDLVPGR